MQDFSLSRDFKNVNWSDTVMYNFLRGASAGLIIGLIVALNSMHPNGSSLTIVQSFITVISFILMTPILLLVIFIPYNFLLGLLNNYTGGGVLFILRIINMLFAFIPALGDPLIHILLKYYPNLIGIEKSGWFQRRIIIFILR